MSLAFSDYVRCADPEDDPAAFAAAWRKLRAALIGELRRRSLWRAPPSRLGIYGRRSWEEDPEALEELLSECYTFVFIRRWQGLKALLEATGNIEGLVFRSLRNFLYETQKKHDPLGFRVFTVLRSAVRSSIAARELHVLEGDPAVGNATVLGFSPHGDPAEALATDPSPQAREWIGGLLPGLVTATRGADLETVLESLAARLARLESQGITAFRFKDVLDPLKHQARSAWNALWQHSEGETALEPGGEIADIVRVVRPEFEAEERQGFETLLECVVRALERLEVPAKTRSYLRSLWLFLRNYATESWQGHDAPGDPAAGGRGKLPSQRRIAALLGIPRYRLPGLHSILGRQVKACQALVAGRDPVPGQAAPRSPIDGLAPDRAARRHRPGREQRAGTSP